MGGRGAEVFGVRESGQLLGIGTVILRLVVGCLRCLLMSPAVSFLSRHVCPH